MLVRVNAEGVHVKIVNRDGRTTHEKTYYNNFGYFVECPKRPIIITFAELLLPSSLLARRATKQDYDMNLSQPDIERLRELIATPAQRMVILSHTNPDGDAVGSSIAWAEALRRAGHDVVCIVPNKYPYYLDWMTGISDVVIHRTDPDRAAAAVAEADVIFCLDFHSLSRLDQLSEVIAANTSAKRVLIDHHLNPTEQFDIMFSHPESSSTCFLVYKVIEALWGAQSVTPSQAEVLYVGMMTDTGNFSFSQLTPELYQALAVLSATGINIPQIYNNVYNSFTEGRARLFGYAINRKMKMLRKGAVAAPEGKKLVIPFNMRDGLIIARGKGNADWNQSAPHGAGRLLSRADAKELIDLDEFKESMKGIYSTSVGTGTIDESPMAYKDPKEIMKLIEDTVEVEYFIRPVINLKATNSYDSSVEMDVNEEQD
jgi:nanoRNase/pAp phosphatase (c-di-AMP/oligoRNAs hydrolase)